MKVSDIKIKCSFSKTKPSEEKMNACRSYFKEHGDIDSKITVNEKGYLVDGYIRYLVLLENGIDETDVIVKDTKSPQKKTYIYGCHNGRGKEYVWRLPKSINKTVVAGNKVLVRTRYGIKPITVTKVEESCDAPSSLPIKRVVKCLED